MTSLLSSLFTIENGMIVLNYVSNYAGYAGSYIAVNQIVKKMNESDDWYDWWNNYRKYGIEFTSDIDDLLMSGNGKYSKVSTIKTVSTNRKIPDVGIHIYFPFLDENTNSGEIIARNKAPENFEKHIKKYCVGFRKIDVKNNKQIESYYHAFFINDEGMQSHDKFENVLLGNILNGIKTVKVISIDTSQNMTKLIGMRKVCQTPKTCQIQAMDQILEHWNHKDNKKHSTMVTISGKSGVGKSYTGILLKQKIEETYKNMDVNLFIDFDPTVIGINISDMALKNLSKNNVVIIMINEIDIAYKDAFIDKQSFGDGRTHHTKNKISFNAMLDSLSESSHVIVIMTTEKTPQDLYTKEEHRPFFRPGRVDFFLQMTRENTTKIENNPDVLLIPESSAAVEPPKKRMRQTQTTSNSK